MIVKRGSVVSHALAQQWGTGKVVEVDDIRATIRFSDGMTRKITSSHFSDLHPADPASYHPPQKATSRSAKKGPAKPKKRSKATGVRA